MDEYNRFWLEFWKIVSITVVIVVLIISVTLSAHSNYWYNSWNACIEKGGEPKQVAIIGSNDLTFTCDLPQ